MLRVLKLNGFSRNGTDVVYFHHENRIRTLIYNQQFVMFLEREWDELPHDNFAVCMCSHFMLNRLSKSNGSSLHPANVRLKYLEFIKKNDFTLIYEKLRVRYFVKERINYYEIPQVIENTLTNLLCWEIVQITTNYKQMYTKMKSCKKPEKWVNYKLRGVGRRRNWCNVNYSC